MKRGHSKHTQAWCRIKSQRAWALTVWGVSAKSALSGEGKGTSVNVFEAPACHLCRPLRTQTGVKCACWAQELTLDTPRRAPLPTQAEGKAASPNNGMKDASQTGPKGAPAPQSECGLNCWDSTLGATVSLNHPHTEPGYSFWSKPLLSVSSHHESRP